MTSGTRMRLDACQRRRSHQLPAQAVPIRDIPYRTTHEWLQPSEPCEAAAVGASMRVTECRRTPRPLNFSRHWSDPEKRSNGNGAAEAMVTAARKSCWRRNQSCDAVIARGAIACLLGGAVRKFAVRPSGRRQIIDMIVTGDFLGFSPADPSFLLEAVSNDTRIASFTRDRMNDLKSRFPAVSGINGELCRGRDSSP